MLKIGLTGGIGAGKSLVSDIFASLGVPIIDADLLSRELLQPGSQCLTAIVEQLGPDILFNDGSLRRDHLKNVIFAHEETRKRVEAILHPAIKSAILTKLSKIHADYCLLVIPLLLEKHWESLVDRVLLVNAPESIRIRRIQDRDGQDIEQILQIFASQISQEQRLKYADDIIDNDKDTAYVTSQVNALHKKYLNAEIAK